MFHIEVVFVVVDVVPSRPLVIKVTQCFFFLGMQEALDALFFVSQSCPPTSFLRCATQNWLMPTKAATLPITTTPLSCNKAWCFCS